MALEQREVAVSAQGAVAEKLRAELEALQRKLDEQVRVWGGGCIHVLGFVCTRGEEGARGAVLGFALGLWQPYRPALARFKSVMFYCKQLPVGPLYFIQPLVIF